MESHTIRVKTNDHQKDLINQPAIPQYLENRELGIRHTHRLAPASEALPDELQNQMPSLTRHLRQGI